MLLALDLRNRVLSAGLRSEGAWLAVRRFGASGDKSADEYFFLLERAFGELLRGMEGGGGGQRSVWISSVVPALTPRLVAAARELCGSEPRVVGPGAKTGLRIRTDNPAELGSDLVCAAVAALELAAREEAGGEGGRGAAMASAAVPSSAGASSGAAAPSGLALPGGARGPAARPVLVADFGTALTLSALSAEGEFLGAAIAPGLEGAAEYLRAGAAQLPEVRLEPPGRAIGRSTAEALRSGILLGYRGLLSGLVERFATELATEASHATGGRQGAEGGRRGGVAARGSEARGAAAAPLLFGSGDELGRYVLESLPGSRFVPDLCLEGLAIIAARQGEARQGEARQGEARQGEARQGEARQGEARQGHERA